MKNTDPAPDGYVRTTVYRDREGVDTPIEVTWAWWDVTEDDTEATILDVEPVSNNSLTLALTDDEIDAAIDAARERFDEAQEYAHDAGLGL